MSVNDNPDRSPDAQSKKGTSKGKAVVKAKKPKTKVQANAFAGRRPSDATHQQKFSEKETKLQRAARLKEQEEARIRERHAYLQRRAARMVHSDNKMLFSRRTCYNMGNKKHPDSPDVYSPVEARNLRYEFKQMQVVRIHRSTRRDLFSRRTRSNMRHRKHPDSPVRYSPIRAQDLRYTFNHGLQVDRIIHRSKPLQFKDPVVE